MLLAGVAAAGCGNANYVGDGGADTGTDARDGADDSSDANDDTRMDAPMDTAMDRVPDRADETSTDAPIDAGLDASGPPTLDEFYARHQELTCRRALECGTHLGVEVSQSVAAKACRTEGILVSRAAVDASIAQGRIDYDDLGARGCLDDLEHLSCDELFRSSAIDCGAAFPGGVTLGNACSMHADCLDGYCDVTAACPGRCVAALPAGSACTHDAYCQSRRCSSLCIDHAVPLVLGGNGAPCNVREPCQAQYSCTGQCRFAAELDEPCDVNTPCGAGLACNTSGVCSVLLEPDALCSANEMCPVGHACLGDPARCVQLGRPGESCMGDAYCTRGTCQAGSCRTWPIGTPCTPVVGNFNSNCDSLSCVGGECGPYLDVGATCGALLGVACRPGTRCELLEDTLTCQPECPSADEPAPALTWGQRWGGTDSDAPWALAATSAGLYIGGQFASTSANFGSGSGSRTSGTPDAAFLAGYVPRTGLVSGFGTRTIDGSANLGGDVVLAVAVDGDVHVVGTMVGLADFGGGNMSGGQGFYARYHPADGTLVGTAFRIPNSGGLTDIAVAGGRIFVAGYYSGGMGITMPGCGGGPQVTLPGMASETYGFVAEIEDDCAIAAVRFGPLYPNALNVHLGVAADLSRVVASWHTTVGASANIVLEIMTDDLALLGTYEYGGTSDDYVIDLAIGPERELYLVGDISCMGELSFAGGPPITVTGACGGPFSVRGFVASLTLDDPPQHRWTRPLAGLGSVARWVHVAPDGDIVFGGGSGTMSSIGFGVLRPMGSSDALVARLSPVGAHRWSFLLRGDGFDTAAAGAVLAGDSLFVAASTNSATVRVNGVNLDALGGVDVLVVGSVPP